MENVNFTSFTANVSPSASAYAVGYFGTSVGAEQRWTMETLRAFMTAALTAANISDFNTVAAAVAPVQSVAGQTGAVSTIPAANVSGLGTMATQNADNVAVTGGTVAGVTLDSIGNVTFQTGAQGGTIRTGTSNADKFVIQAYDTNGGVYVKVAEADAGNEPTFELFSDTFFIWDSTDETKRARFNAQAITSGATRAYTLPDENGTLVVSAFKTLAVAGQDNVVAATATDLLTLVAGSNVTLTTNATAKTVTIAAAGGGGGGGGLADPGANGVVVRTAENVTTARAIIGGNGVTVDNGTGVSANMTVSVANASTTVLGIVELAEDAESSAGLAVQANDSRLSNARTPTAHASTHTNGTDDIQDATAAQKGLMTAAYASKLDGIPANATNNAGTVTSVAVSATDGLEVDSGSPVTTSGTITLGVNAVAMRAFLNVANGATNNTGTVTSVAVSGGSTGLTTSGGPITGSGTITLEGVLVLANGGTGGTNAATARANLGLVIGTDVLAYVAPGTDGNVLTSNGTAWVSEAPAGGGGGGTKTYAFFTPCDNQPPASNFATLDTRNSIGVLDFDDTTEESAIFNGIMPEAASLGSGLKVRIHWMATTATSGNCRWGVAFQAMNATTDNDSDSFDTAAEATTAAEGTSGETATTEITITTIDSITAGVPYRLKVYRDTSDGADTMAGDAEVIAVEVRSAA